MPFVSSANKDFIRGSYDKKIIMDCGSKSSYFGLPGSDILDLKEWKPYLDCITAVESDDISAHRLLGNIYRGGFSLSRFQLLHGDVDEILINGFDREGSRIRLPFNLANLDYQGGIVCKEVKGGSKRIRAIESLFERQRVAAHDFLLLFSFNSRNRDEGEFNSAIDDVESHLANVGIASQEVEEVFDWYRSADYCHKIKIFVLHLIDQIARTRQFQCKFFPPVTYLGSGNVRMVHFAFRLKWVRNIGPRLSNVVEILNTPLKEVREGRIANLQIPLLKLRQTNS